MYSWTAMTSYSCSFEQFLSQAGCEFVNTFIGSCSLWKNWIWYISLHRITLIYSRTTEQRAVSTTPIDHPGIQPVFFTFDPSLNDSPRYCCNITAICTRNALTHLTQKDRTPKSCHITPVLRSLHWLRINERIKCKLLSVTYKVLATNQPQYLHNLISVQPCHGTRSSSTVTLTRPPSRPLWKSPIALFGTLHLVSGMHFPRNYACLVTHSLPHLHLLLHMAMASGFNFYS